MAACFSFPSLKTNLFSSHTNAYLQLNDLAAVKVLVAFGGEVNSLNPNDQTPLDIATKCHPDGEIVTLLVSVGGQTGQYVVHEKLSFL